MQLPRLVLRLMLAVTLPLSAVTLIASASVFSPQKPINHEIHDFLKPPHCPAPCWMGIRPGVTTLDEARELLRASPWVNQIYEAGLHDPDSMPHIGWDWTLQAPSFVYRYATGAAIILNGVVAAIELTPKLTFGEVQSAIGPPDRVEVDDIGVSWHAIMEFNRYDDDTLTFESWYVCPLTHAKRFNAWVRIMITTTGFSRKLGNLPVPCQ